MCNVMPMKKQADTPNDLQEPDATGFGKEHTRRLYEQGANIERP